MVANGGPQDFPAFDLPWPWAGAGGAPVEHGAPVVGAAIRVHGDAATATLSLAPFQVRVLVV